VCVCVGISVCDVGVLWLNFKMDRDGFWCESYHRGQLLCILCGSSSIHSEEDLEIGCWTLKIFGSWYTVLPSVL